MTSPIATGSTTPGRSRPILAERVRGHRQAELDALDEPFRVATAPIRPIGASQNLMTEHTRWWRFRYPLLVTGDATEQLPPTWSPAPVHVE
ncbi:hypothetical protein ACF1HJ_10945 [Streptomyces sp. NPDC013978]|uniref:hypothetical protein n=1 Tax=Streptomyces sp. NPDC013978 TaxID=3364869 RepID=UPI0036F7E164